MKWYYLLQAKYYLAVGQYQALIRQTDELRTIEPQLRHIRAIGIKHQYGMSCCILSLKRGIKKVPGKYASEIQLLRSPISNQYQ